MTVQELIDTLERVKDKTQSVGVSVVDSRGNEIMDDCNGAYMTYNKTNFETTAIVVTSLKPYYPI